MRHLKTVLGLLLCVALLLGSVGGVLANSPGQSFADSKKKNPTINIKIEFKDWDDNYWAADAIARMLLRQIVIGDGGQIWPDRHVSRIEALLTLYRLYDWDSYRGTRNTTSLTRDLDELIPDWGYDAVIEGLHRKLVDKKGRNLGLNDKLTRLEATVLLVRAAGLEAEAIRRSGEDLRFKDQNAIPGDYRGYVAVAVENGLIKGYPDGVFQPNKAVTRAEWFAMLTRLEDFFPPATTPGHFSQVRGTVTEVRTGSNASLTINTRNQLTGGTTYRLASEYEVFVDGRRGSLSEIQAGDGVWAYLDGDARIFWTSVSTEASTASGRITAWRAPTSSRLGSITLNNSSGDKTYSVSQTATVQIGKYQTSFDEIEVGQQAKLTVQRNVVTHIHVDEQTTVEGTVNSFTAPGSNRNGTISVKTSSGNKSYAVYPSATVTVDGKSGRFSDVRVDDPVKLTVKNNLVTAIQVTRSSTAKGTIVSTSTSSSGRSIRIKDSGNRETNHPVASNAEIISQHGTEMNFNQLLPGDQVELQLDRGTVTKVKVTKAIGTTVEGTVTTFSAPSSSRNGAITVKTSSGDKSYAVSPSAIVTVDGQSGRFSDVRIDDHAKLTVHNNLVTAIQVTLATSLKGTVESTSTAGSDRVITVKESGKAARSYVLVGDAVITSPFGDTLRFTDLTAGDQVDLTLVRGLVTRVNVTIAAEITVEGTVKATALSSGHPASITITRNRTDHKLDVSRTVDVEYKGAAFNFTDIRQGDTVLLTVTAGTVTAIDVRARAPQDVSLTGTVADHNTSARTFVLQVPKSGGGTTDYDIRYTGSTSFTIGGHGINASALANGSRVKVTASDADGFITASKVEVEVLAP